MGSISTSACSPCRIDPIQRCESCARVGKTGTRLFVKTSPTGSFLPFPTDGGAKAASDFVSGVGLRRLYACVFCHLQRCKPLVPIHVLGPCFSERTHPGVTCPIGLRA